MPLFNDPRCRSEEQLGALKAKWGGQTQLFSLRRECCALASYRFPPVELLSHPPCLSLVQLLSLPRELWGGGVLETESTSLHYFGTHAHVEVSTGICENKSFIACPLKNKTSLRKCQLSQKPRLTYR